MSACAVHEDERTDATIVPILSYVLLMGGVGENRSTTVASQITAHRRLFNNTLLIVRYTIIALKMYSRIVVSETIITLFEQIPEAVVNPSTPLRPRLATAIHGGTCCGIGLNQPGEDRTKICENRT